MTRKFSELTLFSLLLAGLSSACMPTFAPAFTPIPTLNPNAVYTAIQETAEAAVTQTQAMITPTLTPTETSTPTKTPSETPSPTVTFVFFLSSPTPSKTPPPVSQGNPSYGCVLLSQTPADNSVFGAGTTFPVRWQVRNSGTLVWNADDVDYHYKSGAKIYIREGYDLYKTIAAGDTVEIVADMSAPSKPGKYETVWTLQSGKTEFCRLTLTLLVQ